MLCWVYTLLYTMGMERRMTKKEEVVSCVQRLAAAAPEKREVGVTTQELAEQLQMQRSNLSTLLNELVADGKMEKLPGRPVHYRPLMAGDTPRGETSCFKILDSCEGSLRPMIQMAKAAILYPDHSLNTLIEGPSGSGKTTFGYLMYQFACENKVLPVGAPFERFIMTIRRKKHTAACLVQAKHWKRPSVVCCFWITSNIYRWAAGNICST